jgi:hypothetical protein
MSQTRAKAEVVELVAHYVGEFGELVVVRAANKPSAIPVGKYRVESVRLRLADDSTAPARASRPSKSRISRGPNGFFRRSCGAGNGVDQENHHPFGSSSSSCNRSASGRGRRAGQVASRSPRPIMSTIVAIISPARC